MYMHRRTRLFAAAAVAVGAMGLSVSTAVAADHEPTTQELLDQIKQLQTKVEQLEHKQQQSSADVAATVQQIVDDAERRSTMFAQTTGQNVLAGHENGKFILRSEDGNYLLNPSFEIQVRNTTNYNTAGDDSWENGFEIRRAKFRFEGNAVTPDLTYALQWKTGQNDGTVTLEDAWVRYKFEPDWFIRGGQFKDPLLHEQLTSGRRQLTADRSLLSLLMTGDSDNYIQGASLIYDGADQPIRAEVAFTDGIGDENTNFRDFPVNENDFGVAGRPRVVLQRRPQAVRRLHAARQQEGPAGGRHRRRPDAERQRERLPAHDRRAVGKRRRAGRLRRAGRPLDQRRRGHVRLGRSDPGQLPVPPEVGRVRALRLHDVRRRPDDHGSRLGRLLPRDHGRRELLRAVALREVHVRPDLPSQRQSEQPDRPGRAGGRRRPAGPSAGSSSWCCDANRSAFRKTCHPERTREGSASHDE
jgi:hypothetical protein